MEALQNVIDNQNKVSVLFHMLFDLKVNNVCETYFVRSSSQELDAAIAEKEKGVYFILSSQELDAATIAEKEKECFLKHAAAIDTGNLKVLTYYHHRFCEALGLIRI